MKVRERERERDVEKYSNLSGLQNHKNRMLPFCWKRRIDFEWFKVFLGKKFKILLCVASGSHVKLAYVRCWNDRVRQQHKDRERYKGGTVVRKRKVSTAVTAADILIYTCAYSCWNDQQNRVSKHGALNKKEMNNQIGQIGSQICTYDGMLPCMSCVMFWCP